MNDLEKYISRYLWKGLDILRGYFDLGVAQRILTESTFIKLLLEQSKIIKNSFTKEFKNREVFKLERNNTEETLEELYRFTTSHPIFEGLFIEINRLKDLNEDLVIGRFIDFIDGMDFSEFKEENGYGNVFRVFIDEVFRSNRLNIKTSPNINLLVSKLLENVKISSLYDPSIGTGSLVTEVASTHEGVSLYGQDISNDMVSLCKMLLILEGRIEDVGNIYQGSTIVSPANVNNGELLKFDCVVCNPPFGLKDWGYDEIASGDKYDRFHRGLPSRSLGDYAFITHVVESLNEDGRAVVIEPSGVLFREGAEGAIREKLIQENIIDCIIALPNNMMYGTALPVNLLIFNKNTNTKDILFIDVSKKVQASKVLTTLSDEIIEELLNVYKNRVSIEGFTRVVSIKEIEDNSWNLNVQRYIEDIKEKHELNISEINNTIKQLQSKLSEIQSEINSYFNNI